MGDTVFITDKEADFLAQYFQDAPLGTIRWDIYDRCVKRIVRRLPRKHDGVHDVYITVEQADIVAAEFVDFPFGTIENNMYEKCRRPCHDKHGKRIAAFLTTQWR